MTRSSYCGASIASALVMLASNVIPSARATESALKLIPEVRGAYQAKYDAISRGKTPRRFSGTASVLADNSEDYPASIGLRGVPQEQGHFCGGVIVDPYWVLTAAHCVSVRTSGADQAAPAVVDPDKLQVLTGTNVLFKGGRTQPVMRIVVHPQYRVTAEGVPQNDLALLQFSEPLNGSAAPVATEVETEQLLRPGTKFAITGWGTASFDATAAISNNNLFAYIDFVERAKCNDPVAYAGAVIDTMFCGGTGSVDACQGDSGGPAYGLAGGRAIVVGIVSWGAGCTNKKFPGVYVNVGKFTRWIAETIGKPRY